MLKKLHRQDFDKIYKLLEISFPDDEYRTYEGQKELFDNPLYSVYGLYDESSDVKMILAIWEFKNFVFLEHFAVNPRYRNQGLGSKALRELEELFQKRICLEVELPETEMARRRIQFYQRNNLFLNEYPYMQPSLAKGKPSIPLLIMTSGGKIDESTFQELKTVLYKEVYQIK